MRYFFNQVFDRLIYLEDVCKYDEDNENLSFQSVVLFLRFIETYGIDSQPSLTATYEGHISAKWRIDDFVLGITFHADVLSVVQIYPSEAPYSSNIIASDQSDRRLITNHFYTSIEEFSDKIDHYRWFMSFVTGNGY